MGIYAILKTKVASMRNRFSRPNHIEAAFADMRKWDLTAH